MKDVVMRCPICGLMGSDYLHIASHVLSSERLHECGMQAGVGGPPVSFPTFRETAMMIGAAIEMGTARPNSK